MNGILYIGIAQSLFASLIVLTKRPTSLADRILGTWFVFIAFRLVLGWVRLNHFPDSFYSISILVLPFSFGPFLYLYIRALTEPNPRFKVRDLLHFIPFVIFMLLVLMLAWSSTNFAYTEFFNFDAGFPIRLFFGLSYVASIVTYSLLSLNRLVRHGREVRDYFSHRDSRITLNWLKAAVVIFSVSYLSHIFSGTFNVLFDAYYVEPKLFSFLGLTSLVYTFSYFGSRQQTLFVEEAVASVAEDEPVTVPEPIPEPERVPVPVVEGVNPVRPVVRAAEPPAKTKTASYARSGLKPEVALEYKEQLIQHMESEKPYLNSKVTIQEISQALSIPKHHLTQVLNQHLKKNFYTFINEYRVEEFKRRMLGDDAKRLTVLAIAYESGFNSKSAFNASFKQATGMTPSEYRISLEKKSSQ